VVQGINPLVFNIPVTDIFLLEWMFACPQNLQTNQHSVIWTRHENQGERDQTRKAGRSQDTVKKKYRVTPSWKEKKVMRNPVINSTIDRTRLRQHADTPIKRYIKLSTNLKN